MFPLFFATVESLRERKDKRTGDTIVVSLTRVTYRLISMDGISIQNEIVVVVAVFLFEIEKFFQVSLHCSLFLSFFLSALYVLHFFQDRFYIERNVKVAWLSRSSSITSEKWMRQRLRLGTNLCTVSSR